jgi:HEAT repeat protein
LALLEYLRAATGDPEMRAVAVRALANCPYERVTDFLRQSKWNGVSDPHPVVKVAALQALGSTRKKDFVPMILLTLRNSADQDATIRHAAVYALVRIGDTDALLAAARDNSASVRLGACLALRRLMHPGIAQFLDDSDPRIVLEAARAIADLPIEPALPKLAALLDPSR